MKEFHKNLPIKKVLDESENLARQVLEKGADTAEISSFSDQITATILKSSE
jgi:3-keto-L-gulonate-6-phosphate decarboxylase